MKRRASVFGICALLSCTAAHADFQSAMDEFNAGHYDDARMEFLALAALGDANSQFNLGAMASRGQGVPASKGTAVGWLLAASENGYQALKAEKLNSLKASLSESERHDAQDILNVYGHEALLRTALPPSDLKCPGLSFGRPALTNDPLKQFMHTHDGMLLVAFTVGPDGHLRDPEIRAVALSETPIGEVASAVFAGLLKWNWQPATLNNVRQELRTVIRLMPSRSPDGGRAAMNPQQLDKLRAAAEAGDSNAAYMVGLATSLDGAPAKARKSTDFMLKAAQAGHPKAVYAVAQRFDGPTPCNTDADPRRLPWLRYAAAAGEPGAELDLARVWLRGPPAPDQIALLVGLLQKAAASDNFRVTKYAVAILAASPIEAIRRPDLALAGAQALSRGPIQSDPQMFEAIAAAYAATGDFANATAQQQMALSKAKALGWNTRLIEERASAYRNKKPWYGDLFAMPAG